MLSDNKTFSSKSSTKRLLEIPLFLVLKNVPVKNSCIKKEKIIEIRKYVKLENLQVF